MYHQTGGGAELFSKGARRDRLGSRIMNPPTAREEEEIAHFSALAQRWWDREGPFAMLHRLNPLRLSYIERLVAAHFGLAARGQSFASLRFLDMGCGGGLLSEPLARMGARVTALDASPETIEIAKAHAVSQGLKIDYRVGTDETLYRERAAKGKGSAAARSYDVILIMEILEHLPDVAGTVKRLGAMLSPSGLLIAATINRTPKSFLFAILGLEYVLGWLPRGTHRYEGFVTPDELRRAFRGGGLEASDETGVMYVPFLSFFRLTGDMDVNYMMAARKGLFEAPKDRGAP